MQGVSDNKYSKRFITIMLILSLAPFTVIPLLGSQFYFRHDDSAALLWAKEFDQPLYHIFSTDPDLNRINNYRGIAGTWRPFSFLYIKVLWNIFREEPAPYHIIAGLSFMAAVIFLFLLLQYRSGIRPAVIGCLSLFAAFHGTMYTLFHIGVPSTFFFQMVMIYCFWLYTRRQRWYHLIGMILFIGPSMSRQTTPIILTAILVTSLIDRRERQAVLCAKNIPALLVLFAGFCIIPLSPGAGKGSIASVFPDYQKTIEFISERFFYYGGLLTTGVTGLFMLLFFGAGVCRHAAGFIGGKYNFNRINWVWPPVALLLAFYALRMQPHSVYWLLFCCLYFFIFDPELRLPIAWAGASLIAFFCVKYYHNGYMLEAAFPLSMALGILITRLIEPAAKALRGRIISAAPKTVSIGIVILLLAITLPAIPLLKSSLVSNRVEMIRISIESNRNFHNLILYLKNEMPRDSEIYELDERYIGMTSYERRFLSLRERTARIKVMSIRDQRVMLKILGRDDIMIHPSFTLKDSEWEGEAYFIALNNFEREIAEAGFDLVPVREFSGPHDSAVIYRLNRQSSK